MSQTRRAVVLAGTCLACFAHFAHAQEECAKLPAEFKSVCEEAAQLMRSCMGKTGLALQDCVLGGARSQSGGDCSKLSGDAGAACELLNSMLEPCRSMSGPPQEACIRGKLEKLGVGRR